MRDKVIEIINGIHPGIVLDNAGKLFDDGMIDSFDIISIISEANIAFGISIRSEDVFPENFNSLDAIVALIERTVLAAKKV